MHRSRAVSARQALTLGLGTTAAALLLPAVLATTAASAAPAPRSPALRTGTVPAVDQAFQTWPEAAAAAGFTLHRPTRLHTLSRTGPVSVHKCEMPGQHHKQLVTAVYGSPVSALLSLAENNSGAPCDARINAPLLRTVSIHGAPASLYGDCGTGSGMGGCRSEGVLELIWVRDGIAYEVKSLSEPQHVLLNFARHLHRVG